MTGDAPADHGLRIGRTATTAPRRAQMSFSASVLIFTLAQGPGVEKASFCSSAESQLWHELTVSEVSMNAESARLRIHERAAETLERCPDSERLAYVSLRAAELGPAQEEPDSGLVAFARELCGRFPRSARIATVRARLERSVDSARKAVTIDPTYPPAQVALANALLAAGDVAGARLALDGIKELAAVENGYAVLASVKWAQGDATGAIQAANRQLARSPSLTPSEPGSDAATARTRAHEILGLSYLKLNQPDRAAPHLLEAEPHSKQVHALLQRADPALRRALARYRRPARR
jgi:tetratricopeptide (TPR) repeat protein